MYDFLAPWGVLIPALSALVIYLRISALRRRRMLKTMEAPNERCRRLITRIVRTRSAPDTPLA